MSAIKRGTSSTDGDLPIIFDKQGMLCDPYSIVFDYMDCTTGTPVLIGSSGRIPVKTGVGKYYAPITVDSDEPLGSHKIAWKYKESASDTEKTVDFPFDVISSEAVTGKEYPDRIKALIYELRKKLRDINPDRDYSFASPSSEKTVAGFTRCRGYRWPDEQLANHIAQAANYINLFAPVTCYDVCDWPCLLEDLLLRQAMVFAYQDLASLWVNEEFDYSLNGISFNIQRSDKYLNMASQLQDQVNTYLERAKPAITKCIKGLFQSPYTFSRGAAIGPLTSGANIRRWVRG
jgi:hypothetical protein